MGNRSKRLSVRGLRSKSLGTKVARLVAAALSDSGLAVLLAGLGGGVVGFLIHPG